MSPASVRKGPPDLGGIAFAMLFLPVHLHLGGQRRATKSQPLGPRYSRVVLLFCSVSYGLAAVFGTLSLLGFGRQHGHLNKLLGGLSLVVGGSTASVSAAGVDGRELPFGEAMKRGEEMANSGRPVRGGRSLSGGPEPE